MNAFPKWLWLMPLAVLMLPPVCELAHLSSFGAGWYQLAAVPSLLTGLLALSVSPIVLIWLCLSSKRKNAAISLLFCVIMVAAAFGGMLATRQVRTEAFRRLATRSKPLVEAIQLYSRKTGVPPARLEDLVPDYLPEVPVTGMGAYSKYEYLTGSKAAMYENNPWILSVKTPIGFLNWDEFFFFPNQNYPEQGYGGRLERIGTWAYLHE